MDLSYGFSNGMKPINADSPNSESSTKGPVGAESILVDEKCATFKNFDFLDDRDNFILTVTVRELLDADYGLYVWPSAPVLAQYIMYNREKIQGKHVLEVGAGTALAGLMAAKCGCQKITLTDHSEKTTTLVNCKASVALNDLSEQQIQVKGLTWGCFTQELMDLKGVDIIIASDCFYNTKDFEPVLVTISYLLEHNPTSEFWCTYQVRNVDRSFDYLLEKWNLSCTRIHPEDFSENIQVVCREGSIQATHEILMLIFTSLSSPP